jgi:hypothetical protein
MALPGHAGQIAQRTGFGNRNRTVLQQCDEHPEPGFELFQLGKSIAGVRPKFDPLLARSNYASLALGWNFCGRSSSGGTNWAMTGSASGCQALIEALVLFEHELLAFAAFWFCLGLIDEFPIELTWLWLRLTGKAWTLRMPVGYGAEPRSGPTAVLILAYQGSRVIGEISATCWPRGRRKS